MYDGYKLPAETIWKSGTDFDYAKKAILTILKDQKVSLAEISMLFRSIIEDIERNNPINY